MTSSRAGAVALLLALACDPGEPSPCPAWTRDEDGRCVLRAWQVPQQADALSEPGARDVQVALGAGGDALVAWADADPVDGHIVVAEGDHGAWTTMPLTIEGGVGLEPAIALAADGRALVAWKQQRDDGAIYLATRSTARAWTLPAAPISWPATAYEPRVAFGSDGEGFLLWNQWTGAHFGVAIGVRDPDAHDFALPRGNDELLSAPVNYANAPRLAVNADGEALITWYQAPVDDLMVFVSERRDADGTFERVAADAFISPTGAPVDSHAEANAWPALDDAGSAAVVWTQQRGGPWDIAVFVATRSPGGTWRSPASLDDALSAPGAFARCPQAAFVESGLAVTWYETRDDDTAVWIRQGDPDDRTIAAMRLSSPEGEAVHPVLAVDRDGGVLVVWVENRRDAPDTWSVVARRYQPGEARWLEPEIISLPQAGLAPTPQLDVSADDGAVLVAWAQGGVLDARVYAAHLR